MARNRNFIIFLCLIVFGLTFVSPLFAAAEFLGLAWWIWVIIVAFLLLLMFWQLRRTKKGGEDKMEEALDEIEPEVMAAIEEASAHDDLSVIEGIGPKISELLKAEGITTFYHLADTQASSLKEIIDKAGLGELADPTTWSDQAKLADDGKMEELKALQEQLKGGRRE